MAEKGHVWVKLYLFLTKDKIKNVLNGFLNVTHPSLREDLENDRICLLRTLRSKGSSVEELAAYLSLHDEEFDKIQVPTYDEIVPVDLSKTALIDLCFTTWTQHMSDVVSLYFLNASQVSHDSAFNIMNHIANRNKDHASKALGLLKHLDILSFQ